MASSSSDVARVWHFTLSTMEQHSQIRNTVAAVLLHNLAFPYTPEAVVSVLVLCSLAGRYVLSRLNSGTETPDSEPVFENDVKGAPA